MALEADEMTHIYTQVVLGTDKADYQRPLSAEASRFWDELAAEVEGMRAEGKGFEIPGEIPPTDEGD